MKRAIIVYLMLWFILSGTIEAKKRPCGNGVYWELTDAGTLIISGSGEMDDYGTFRDKAPWFSKRHKIKEINIEEGITYIGKDAFCLWKSPENYNAQIEVVRIPKSLKCIGGGAFLNTTVSKVYISDLYLWCKIDFSITETSNPCYHGARLFNNNLEIRNLIIPTGITKVKPFAFAGCKSLISVNLNAATCIGEYAFKDCTNLNNVIFSNNTDTIGAWAFAGCNLSKLSIPISVTFIGKSAFELVSKYKHIQKYFANEIICLPKWFINEDKQEWEKCGISEFSVKQYISSVRNKNGDVLIASKYGRKIEKCSFSSNEIDYYIVEEDGKLGLINSAGLWVIPQSDSYSEISVDKGYIKVKNKNSYGILSLDGKEIISTSRGYSSISNRGNKTFAFTKKGVSGICDAQGREISATKLAPTADDIKANGGYASAVEMKNGSTKFYKVSKGGRYGLTDSEGKEIVPCEMEALESAGTGYLKYKLNGFWGVMNYTGKIIIDTDRGYTSIGDFKTFNKRFAYTMTGYKGECDASGRQISKIKVDTPQQTIVKQETQQDKKEKEKIIIIEPKPTPQPKPTLQPMTEWVPCSVCGHNPGVCQTCVGMGETASGRRCISCRGTGKCHFCNGQGGRYQTVYR